jgi:hypothetical protein
MLFFGIFFEGKVLFCVLQTGIGEVGKKFASLGDVSFDIRDS